MNFNQVIKYPILTEKTENLRSAKNLYTFAVDVRSNKVEIRQAIEFIFDVKVLDVRVVNYDKKAASLGRSKGFKPAVKKAYVQLDEKSKIILYQEEAEAAKKQAKLAEKEAKKAQSSEMSEAEKKAAEKIAKAAEAKTKKVENKPKSETKVKEVKETKVVSEKKEEPKKASEPAKTTATSKAKTNSSETPKKQAVKKPATKKETK